MAKREPVGSFNKDYLAKVSKADFLKSHKHLEDNGFNADTLTEIWEKANPKKSEKKD